MSPDYIETARIETQLMMEFLVTKTVRPDIEDCVWIEDVPCGPSAKGIKRLIEVQRHYGMCHVTTGNASPGAKGLVCGLYVRESAYYDAPNFLRDHLSK